MRFATLFSLIFLFACSGGGKTVSDKAQDAGTFPFRKAEAEFIRWVFLSPHRGWQTYQVPGTAPVMVPALESFRNHPKEVLPVLISGWESGWHGYPWKTQDAPPVQLDPHNSDLLQAILCLEPREAEAMLVRAFLKEGGKPEERIDAIETLYWRLHSSRWKELLEPLAAREESPYEFIFAAYCAQENDPSGLKTAERILKKEAPRNGGVESAEIQSFVYQLRGDLPALQAYFKRCQDLDYAHYPLWALIYMHRDDVVQDLADHSARKEKRELAHRTLAKAKEWRAQRSLAPCDTSAPDNLSDTMPARFYGPSSPGV